MGFFLTESYKLHIFVNGFGCNFSVEFPIDRSYAAGYLHDLHFKLSCKSYDVQIVPKGLGTCFVLNEGTATGKKYLGLFEKLSELNR